MEERKELIKLTRLVTKVHKTENYLLVLKNLLHVVWGKGYTPGSQGKGSSSGASRRLSIYIGRAVLGNAGGTRSSCELRALPAFHNTARAPYSGAQGGPRILPYGEGLTG